MSARDGGPAFPFGHISEVTGQPVNGFYDPGMSLRAYIATKAMQVLLANPTILQIMDEDAIAGDAVVMADALLAALEEPKEGV